MVATNGKQARDISDNGRTTCGMAKDVSNIKTEPKESLFGRRTKKSGWTRFPKLSIRSQQTATSSSKAFDMITNLCSNLGSITSAR